VKVQRQCQYFRKTVAHHFLNLSLREKQSEVSLCRICTSDHPQHTLLPSTVGQLITHNLTLTVLVNDDLFDRLETVRFFRLFTGEGDMENTGQGNTEPRGLKARVLP
jgi:hypothetical protein